MNDYLSMIPEGIKNIIKGAIKNGNGVNKVVMGTIDENGNPIQMDVTDEVVNTVINEQQPQIQEQVVQRIEPHAENNESNVVVQKSNNTAYPAVVFNGYNLYTPNGVVNCDASSYNRILAVNSLVLERVFNYASNTNKRFAKHTIDNVMTTNISLVVDNFIATLMNIYASFTGSVSNILNTKLELDNSIFGFQKFADGFMEFLCSNNEERKEILEKMINDYAISFINNAGINIFNYTRSQVGNLISNYQYFKEKINNNAGIIMQLIDKEFSNMMQNMTYECAVFVHNLSNITPYLLENNE